MKLIFSIIMLSIFTTNADDTYRKKVKPLIEKNCLSCHGDYHLDTWYRDMFIVEGIIQDHMKEAKQNLDLTDDFNFKGKGSQSDIYWSIARSIEMDRMPPYYFKYPHLDLQFSEEDKNFLIKWFKDKSKELMKDEK